MPKGEGAPVIDFSQVEERDLASFSGDTDARGAVYLSGSRPFLNLHLFPNSYTLYWPSSPDPNMLETVGSSFQEVLEDLLSQAAKPQAHTTLTALVSDGKYFVEKNRAFEVQPEQGDILPQEVKRFLDPLWLRMASLHAELSPSPPNETAETTKFAIWTDTLQTPIRRETGIQAAYGLIPRKTLPQLITTTSTLLRQSNPEQLGKFLEGVVSKHRLATPRLNLS